MELKWMRMKCRLCGKFISVEEAENSTGKIGDAYRGLGTCSRCESKTIEEV